MSDQSTDTKLVNDWNDQLFGVQRSIRYHARRQAFYDTCNNLTNAVSIILGAGTIAALVNTLPAADQLKLVFPAVITVVSTFNLVFGTARAARTHNDLYRRFVAIEADMMVTTALDEQALARVRRERLSVEADEPPTKFALDVMCHNELVRAKGGEEYRSVTPLQRFLAHFFSFAEASFPLRRNEASSAASDREA